MQQKKTFKKKQRERNLIKKKSNGHYNFLLYNEVCQYFCAHQRQKEFTGLLFYSHNKILVFHANIMFPYQIKALHRLLTPSLNGQLFLTILKLTCVKEPLLNLILYSWFKFLHPLSKLWLCQKKKNFPKPIKSVFPFCYNKNFLCDHEMIKISLKYKFSTFPTIKYAFNFSNAMTEIVGYPQQTWFYCRVKAKKKHLLFQTTQMQSNLNAHILWMQT